VTCIQQGEALAIKGYPTFPNRLFSKVPQVDGFARYTSPQRYGLGVRGFGAEWMYVHRTTGLTGLPVPNLPPR
jgi:hypothetical protein